MNELIELFLQQTITIFAIVDPLGVSAVLLSLTPANTSSSQMTSIAKKTTFTILVAFFVVLFTGDALLRLFGISIDSIKVMGGIILLITAIKMVEGMLEPKNQTPEEEQEAKQSHEFAIIPLGIPITFGPGIFATIVIYKAQASEFLDLLTLCFAFLVTAFATFIIFKYSLKIRNLIGITGQKIVTRVMGLIVGAIAVQFIVSGISVLWGEYTSM